MRQPLDPRPLTQPHPQRLDPGHPRRGEILVAHGAALVRGEPGYLDPESGLFVLTAGYLAERGTCCGQGCRHCPYLRTRAVPGTRAVPEPEDERR